MHGRSPGVRPSHLLTALSTMVLLARVPVAQATAAPPATRPAASTRPPTAPPSRADSMLAVGRLRAAEDALYAAVSAAPRASAPRGALGRYLASRGRFPIAQVLYEEALRFGADRRVVTRAIAQMAPYRPDSALRGGATVRFVFSEDGRTLGAFRAESVDSIPVPVTVVVDPRITGFAVRRVATAPRALRLGALTLAVTSPTADSTIAEGEVRAGVDLLWRHGFTFDERAGTLTLGGRGARTGGPMSYVPVMLTFPGLAFVPRPGITPIPMEREGARRLVRGARWWLDAEQGALVVER